MTSDTIHQPAAVRAWLRILHGDSPGLVNICSTGDWAGNTFDNLDQATDYVTQLHTAGREGIYCRVTTLSTAPVAGKRGGVEDSAALPALWADLDLAGPGHAETDLPPDEAAGRRIITTSGLPEPTIWVHSGGGLYPIWLLDKPHLITADTLDATKRLTKQWQAVIEHAAASLGWRYGRGVGDLARVLRIPGTINRKAGLARPCRIITATPARYTVEQLTTALDTTIARITPQAPTAHPPVIGAPAPVTPRADSGLTPGDDFAARTDWAAILEPAGWREHYRQDDVTYWTRPGKTTGTSASTNALGTDRLHIFTTSAAPLDGDESYSKLGAYAALAHGGDHHAAAKALAAAGYGTPLPDPGIAHREALADILGGPVPDPPAAPAAQVGAGRGAWTPEIDVSNTAVAADWLRHEAGRGRLAGLFLRLGAVVHTPREGEDGYVELTGNPDDRDGPAQVQAVDDSRLASRITYTYGVYRMVKVDDDYEPKPALFPRPASRTALDVPDLLPNLRVLRGVIHSPILRADGTLLDRPGYDESTGLLHLPEPGLVVPPIPAEPTASDVRDAVKLVLEMIDGFPFSSPAFRANYVGALITPLLRAIAPPPYKLHAIEAHQPGSGKTLLANIARWIHGGVFRAEMPEDDTELRKQITSILTVTTGPVVVIDNVAGVLKSSALAGLLTAAEWDDRVLGSTNVKRGINDRIWTITGNNLNIGGDLPRRTLRTVIDPGRPNPELRTGFAITDLEGWVRARRGELLHALLVIVRAWAVAGRPVAPERSSDGYARWVRTVEGILTHAGIDGGFDAKSTQIDVGTDDDEWGDFLKAAHRAYADRTWTAKELLGGISTSQLTPSLIAMDALPDELAKKATMHPLGPTGIAKSLGWWLRNRDGRWAGGLTCRSAGKDGHDIGMWRIFAQQEQTP